MSEFDDLEKKAEAYAEEHPEKADKGINDWLAPPPGWCRRRWGRLGRRGR